MQVLDCQSYAQKPSAAAMGMVPGVVATDFVLTATPDRGINQPNLNAALQQAAAANTALLVDIEVYNLDDRFSTHSWIVGRNALLAEAFATAKTAVPGGRIAFDFPDYYWPNRPSDAPANQAALRTANLDPALKQTVALIDEFGPMLYFGTYDGKTLATPMDLMWEWLNSFWGEAQAVDPNRSVIPTVCARMIALPGAPVGTLQPGVDSKVLLQFLRVIKQFQGGAIKKIRVFDDQGYDAVPQPLASQPWFTTLVGFCKNESGL